MGVFFETFRWKYHPGSFGKVVRFGEVEIKVGANSPFSPHFRHFWHFWKARTKDPLSRSNSSFGPFVFSEFIRVYLNTKLKSRPDILIPEVFQKFYLSWFLVKSSHAPQKLKYWTKYFKFDSKIPNFMIWPKSFQF